MLLLAVHECDLVLSIGARFDDGATGGELGKFAPDTKIIHINIKSIDYRSSITGSLPYSWRCKKYIEASFSDLLPGRMKKI